MQGLNCQEQSINRSDRNSCSNFQGLLTTRSPRVVLCAIIDCGTSRIIVMDGNNFPGEENDESRNLILSQILFGDEDSRGLGGEHYQLNKIVLLSKPNSCLQNEFSFQFYQGDKQHSRIFSGLECGNATAGAALFALLTRMVIPNKSGVIQALNEGTGQRSQISPVSIEQLWKGHWRVRFIHDELLSNCLSPTKDVRRNHILVKGHPVYYTIIAYGNRFVLVNAHSSIATSSLVEQLSEISCSTSVNMLDNAQDTKSATKIIFYEVRSCELTNIYVDAICFYAGEQHKSLPGSGAMCLAAFLASEQLKEHHFLDDSESFTFSIQHPSGVLNVNVSWQLSEGGYRIISTEFITPVKLLFSGETIVYP